MNNLPAFERLTASRIVADPAALDAADWPDGALALRVAPDEVLLTPATEVDLADPYAIVIDDTGYAAAWVDEGRALAFLARHCEWAPPETRPAFAQGAAARTPIKLFFADGRVLFIVPMPYAADFGALFDE